MTVDLSVSELHARIAELEHQLELERARNAGLERGVTALDQRVTELRERETAEPTPA